MADAAPAPHRALYRRWRAQTFGEIVGQEAVVTTLRNAVRTNRLAHGLLFVGPRGTGKTSLARIVAKAINCSNVHDGEPDDTCEACAAIREGRALDVIEMDAASNNKVDDMRELLERTWTAPSDLKRKVYIVDEVQRIKEGWDVLLKTLEEPPDHVVFIFCTTDASQIRPAVLSRVQRFDFTRLSVEQIAGKLDRILTADGRTAEPGAVQLVARLAAGGMRDAESILDQVLSSGEDPLTEARVGDLLGLVDAETVLAFLDALVRGHALAGLGAIDGLEERGRDLHVFLDQVVDTVRQALTGQLGEVGAAWPLADLVAVGRRLAAIDPSRASIGGLRFQLELALLEGATMQPAEAAPAAEVVPVAAVVRSTATASEPVAGRSREAAVIGKPVVEPVAVAVEPVAVAVGAAPVTTAPAAETAEPTEPVELVESDAPADRGEPPASTKDARSPESARSAKPARPAEAADGVTASPGLTELIAAWPRIVAELSSSPPIKPLVEACRPIEMTGNQVILGFPEGKAFLRDVAERRRTHLEEGIGRVLGRAVAVRLVATNLDLLPAPAAEEVDLLTMARRVFADDLVDAEEVR
jgi:DNA polymerase III subunit gamma/tau